MPSIGALRLKANAPYLCIIRAILGYAHRYQVSANGLENAGMTPLSHAPDLSNRDIVPIPPIGNKSIYLCPIYLCPPSKFIHPVET